MSNTVTITIRCPVSPHGYTYKCTVPADTTVRDLKQKISEEYEGKPAVATLRLIFLGRVLDDSVTLGPTFDKLLRGQGQSAEELARLSEERKRDGTDRQYVVHLAIRGRTTPLFSPAPQTVPLTSATAVNLSPRPPLAPTGTPRELPSPHVVPPFSRQQSAPAAMSPQAHGSSNGYGQHSSLEMERQIEAERMMQARAHADAMMQAHYRMVQAHVQAQAQAQAQGQGQQRQSAPQSPLPAPPGLGRADSSGLPRSSPYISPQLVGASPVGGVHPSMLAPQSPYSPYGLPMMNMAMHSPAAHFSPYAHAYSQSPIGMTMPPMYPPSPLSYGYGGVDPQFPPSPHLHRAMSTPFGTVASPAGAAASPSPHVAGAVSPLSPSSILFRGADPPQPHAASDHFGLRHRVGASSGTPTRESHEARGDGDGDGRYQQPHRQQRYEQEQEQEQAEPAVEAPDGKQDQPDQHGQLEGVPAQEAPVRGLMRFIDIRLMIKMTVLFFIFARDADSERSMYLLAFVIVAYLVQVGALGMPQGEDGAANEAREEEDALAAVAELEQEERDRNEAVRDGAALDGQAAAGAAPAGTEAARPPSPASDGVLFAAERFIVGFFASLVPSWRPRVPPRLVEARPAAPVMVQ